MSKHANAENEEAEAAGEKAATSTGDADLARAVADLNGESMPATEPEASASEPEKATEPTKAEAGEPVDGDTGKKPEKETEWRGVPPETQEKFEKRLGREVSRRKELEELLESERTVSRKLKQDAEERARAVPAGAEGLLNAETDAELDTHEDKLLNLLEWCEDHPEGYEGKGTAEDPNLSADDIQTKAHALRRELRAIPRARALIARRAAYDGPVREHYPDMLEAESEMGSEAKRLLATVPGLRMLPDYKLRIGDMIAGRRAREGKTPVAPVTSSVAKPAAKPAAKPPAAPGAGVPAAAMRPQGAGHTKKRNNVDVMADGGFSAESLAAALEQQG
jgi:hypothetical protein